MSRHELMHALGQGNYVIAGVSPKDHPDKKGGHLVLMLGYDKAKQVFCLHNPSDISEETQAYATVSFADFAKFFSGQGIVVSR